MVSPEFLDLTDICSIQEHVCRVAVPHRMQLYMLCDPGAGNSPVVRSAERTFVHVVSAYDTVVGVH